MDGSTNFGRFFGGSIVLTRTQIFCAQRAFQMPQAICTARRWTFWHAQFFSGFGGTIWLGIVAQNIFMVWNSWVQCSYNPYIGLDAENLED